MPLLKGRKNIGHNIKVEEEHGKPHKQAVAIALRTAGVPKRGKDVSGSVKVCKGCGRAYQPDAGDKGWCKPCQYVLPNLGKAKDEVLPPSVIKAAGDQLYAAVRVASKELQRFPKLANGLPTEETRTSPEWRRARQAWVEADKAWKIFQKKYAKELKAASKDEVLPVDGDRERKVALKKYELGLTKSQDTADEPYMAMQYKGGWTVVDTTAGRHMAEADLNGKILTKSDAERRAEELNRKRAKAHDAAADPITGFEKGGGTAARNCANCRYMVEDGGCDQPVMVKKSEQPKNAEGLPIVHAHDVCKFFEEAGRAKDMRRGGEVMPVGDEEQKIARWESKGGKYWVDLYFNPAFKLADGRTVADAHYRGDSSGGSIQAGTAAEAINVMQKRIDRGGFQPDAAKTPMRRVKDELPVPVKTSSLVPLPSGERNEVSYAAPRRAKDALSRAQAEELVHLRATKKKRALTEAETKRFYELRKIGGRPANDAESAWRLLQAGKRLEERGLLKTASKTFSEAVSAAVEERDDEARREATAAVARIRHKEAGTAEDEKARIFQLQGQEPGQLQWYFVNNFNDKAKAQEDKRVVQKLHPNNRFRVVEKARVGDADKRATDHSGSEPKDHLARAKQYEIVGDRARALDAYRTAASGYRKANDRAGEAEAREGIEACQARFAQQYDHPGRGRIKVCDSTESALRTALERTRAGETVTVDGKTVRPGRARDARELTVPEKHQLRIAKQTINMPDAMVGVMGGPSKSEAREIIKRLTGKESKDYYEKVKDEHEGFAKLERSLAHEKGVHDPKAVAAAIGRKKYGAAGMARKAAAGRAKDDTTEQAARDNCVRAERAVRRGLITEGTVYAQRAVQQAKQLGHTAILARAEELLKRAKEA